MIIEKIGEGASYEEALNNARKFLNAPDDVTVKFETISAGSKKILGLFGGKKAQVRAYYEVEDKKKPEKKQPKAKKENKPKKNAEKKPEKKAEKKEDNKPAEEERKREPVSPERLAAAKSAVEDYLKIVLKEMLGTELSVNVVEDSEDSLYITLSSDDDDIDGIVIGRRGETLDSLQYLASLVANKGHNDYVRVTLDIANYREKRQATLTALAQKNAKHVLRSGRRVTLEPMNPYERHIIHTAIQEIEGVKSHSIGSNVDRRVVISPEDGYRPRGGGNRRGGSDRRGGDRRRSSAYKPKVEADREPKKDNTSAPLYGIITTD